MSRLSGSAPVVVVGASVAGLTVAESLRAEGFEGPIQLIGDEAHLPYGRPPLSKQILAGSWTDDRATLSSAAALAEQNIEVRTGCPVTRADLAHRRVEVEQGWQDYSELVVATGLRARRLPAVGGEVAGLRTIDDVRSLRPALHTARQVVVVGGGVLGQEFAAVAAGLGADVTLVQNLPTLQLGTLGPLLSDRLADLHRAYGVSLRLGVAVRSAIRQPRGRWQVSLDDGSRLSADLVLACLGGIPNTEWLQGNGLDLSDGVRCDAAGRAAPGVHAVGDVARWYQPGVDRWLRTEHQTSAIEQAVVVARGLVHGTYPGVAVPYFWSDQYGVKIQAYGSFDRTGVLEPIGSDGGGELLASRSGDAITGVVGWNAGRAFRAARSLVQTDAGDALPRAG